jgi:hypothetical protein
VTDELLAKGKGGIYWLNVTGFGIYKKENWAGPFYDEYGPFSPLVSGQGRPSGLAGRNYMFPPSRF